MRGLYYERALIRKHQRELEVKRNIVLLLASITVILILILFMKSTISSEASDSNHIVNYKYFKSIEVKRGDTLWTIANEYMDNNEYNDINDYIQEIKRANSLQTTSIKAGSYLIIPYYSTVFQQ